MGKVLKDFGLPQKGNHFIHGHLYIKFKIVFPLSSSLSNDKKIILTSALIEVAYPDVVEEVELGIGSRVKVNLTVDAAMKLYRQRREMTAYGIIAEGMREEADAWPVELDPLDSDGEPRVVVVPAAWVELADEGSRSSRSEKKKTKKKNRKGSSSRMPIDEEDQEEGFEDKEEVFLETIVGDTPKPTPAQGGSIHDDDQDEPQPGGVQCQQM